MRNVDAATIAALQNPEGLVVRDLITIRPKTFEGADAAFGFWSDSGDVTVTVLTPEGLEEQRDFSGSGALVDIGEVPLTQALEVHKIPVIFSQLHAAVQNMARGHELRDAPVEIHRMLLDVDTRLAVAPAQLHFVGEVVQVSIDTPAGGAVGSIRLFCVSDARQLTRVNHTRRGLAHSQARAGDKFLTYAGQVAQWEIWWGEEGSRRPGAGTAGGGNTGGDRGGARFLQQR